MRWYLIKDGVVVNLIVADQTFIDLGMGKRYDAAVDEATIYGEKPGIGWSYADGIFSAP